MTDPTDNPFRILDTRPIYANPWIEVVEHRVVRPDGAPGIYGVVKFANRAVGVIPYERGRIWLVGQFRFALGRYSWELPEGGAPAGEAMLEAARRELAEETGFRAESFELLLRMHLSNSVTDEYGEVYLARGLVPGEAKPEGTEVLSLTSVTLEEAYARVLAGNITDAMTVAGVLRLRLLALEGALD